MIVIYGSMGAGKTLFACWLAVNDDRMVASNFKLEIPGWKPLEPQDLVEVNEPTLVIIDEAYVWLESRLSGQDINRFMSYILFQSRKRSIDFVITTQLLSAIDLRFKNLADVFIEAIREPDGFKYVAHFPGRRKTRAFRLSVSVAEPYFKLYNTMEKISPIDDELVYRVTTNKATIKQDLEVVVNKMLDIAPAKKWTVAAVEDYVMENELPYHFRKLLYGRMKGIVIRQPEEEVNASTS